MGDHCSSKLEVGCCLNPATQEEHTMLILLHEPGTVPLSIFFDNCNNANERDKLLHEGGSGLVRLLFDKDRMLRLVRLLQEGESGPVRLLFDKDRMLR